MGDKLEKFLSSFLSSLVILFLLELFPYFKVLLTALAFLLWIKVWSLFLVKIDFIFLSLLISIEILLIVLLFLLFGTSSGIISGKSIDLLFVWVGDLILLREILILLRISSEFFKGLEISSIFLILFVMWLDLSKIGFFCLVDVGDLFSMLFKVSFLFSSFLFSFKFKEIVLVSLFSSFLISIFFSFSFLDSISSSFLISIFSFEIFLLSCSIFSFSSSFLFYDKLM